MEFMLLASLRLRTRPPIELTLDDYLLDLPVVHHLAHRETLEFTAPVTFFVGDNGAGKSTLVEALAIALGFDARGGPLNGFDPGLHSPSTGTESRLHRQLVLRTSKPILRGFYLRAETHFDMITRADISVVRAGRNHLDSGNRLQQRWHGESILDLVAEQIDGEGIYLFDEPEAGLFIVRQMALIAEIDQAVACGAQFIIATHSPILPAVPGARIYEINDAGVMPTSFDTVESVAATREFLADPAGTIDYLLG